MFPFLMNIMIVVVFLRSPQSCDCVKSTRRTVEYDNDDRLRVTVAALQTATRC